MTLQLHPSNEPSIHPTTDPKPSCIYNGLGGKNSFHQQLSRQEHEEALLEECDAQLEAAAHPDGPAMTGEDGTEQEFFFWGGARRFLVFFSAAWVERRTLTQRKMIQPLKRQVGCVAWNI